MAMSSVPTAPTTRSFMKCTRTPTNFPCSTANSATGKMSTTACGLTRPSPTSLRSNSSVNTNENKERQSVTNLLDEYINFLYLFVLCYTYGSLEFNLQAPFRNKSWQ